MFPAQSFLSDFSGIDTKTPGVPALHFAQGCKPPVHVHSRNRRTAGHTVSGSFVQGASWQVSSSTTMRPLRPFQVRGSLPVQLLTGCYSCLLAYLRPSTRSLGALHRLEMWPEHVTSFCTAGALAATLLCATLRSDFRPLPCVQHAAVASLRSPCHSMLQVLE